MNPPARRPATIMNPPIQRYHLVPPPLELEENVAIGCPVVSSAL